MHLSLRSALQLACLALPFSAVASPAATPECLRIAVASTPSRAQPESRLETWCYLDQRIDGQEYRIVYQGDGSVPEDAVLLRLDERREPVALTHSAISAGQRSWATVTDLGLSPIPAPLTATEARAMGGEPIMSLQGFDARGASLAQELVAHATTPVRALVEPGTFESMLGAGSLPWRAYWWPFRNFPLGKGASSPLGKYDRFVKARTGVDPGSSAWEGAHHSLDDVEWGGHCNGWVSETMLYAEPKVALWDSRARVRFGVSELKGILAEASFCTSYAFYGTRNNGNGDPRDIYPARFHAVLTHYIDRLGKTFAMDYKPDEKVDNHPVTGYRMVISQVTPRTLRVDATLRMHGYDTSRTENVGVARIYSRLFSYMLDVDAAGNPVGNGTWLSANPDFMWSSTAQVACGDENPRITPVYLGQLLGLPADTAVAASDAAQD